MINTNAPDLGSALKIGTEFKKLVNDKYRLLEIDIDGVFQRMLLLQKKKYAALKVDNFETGETSTEIKGLDMKRREYCDLSKNTSSYVLKQILSGQSTEVVVEAIHEYLETVGKGVRNGDVQLDDFIIHKVRRLCHSFVRWLTPCTASRQEPERLPRREELAARPGRYAVERERSARIQVGRRRAVYLLHGRGSRDGQDGAGEQGKAS